jgi:DNA-directed RNA polymerase subunit RPC12/RpoP
MGIVKINIKSIESAGCWSGAYVHICKCLNCSIDIKFVESVLDEGYYNYCPYCGYEIEWVDE